MHCRKYAMSPYPMVFIRVAKNIPVYYVGRIFPIIVVTFQYMEGTLVTESGSNVTKEHLQQTATP